ncbi:MAG: serine hydrolase, partial [Pseudomonadota bacterium]
MRLLPAAALVALAFDANAGGAEMEARLKAGFAAGDLDGLHSVLILHEGEVFGEAHFPGVDERWGTPLGVRDHGPDTLHDLRSVTKSVASILYGIALEKGLVPPVDASLVAAFPAYADLADDPARAAITVEDALTMRMGVEWDETLPYSDPRNSEIAMENAEDRYRFALSRPIVEEPGTVWRYNGGATALIGRLIELGAGEPLDVFAERVLFKPLAIERFEWVKGADGTASAASGLRLRIGDMAKIGRMIVEGGVWEGRRVVSESWIEAMLTPRTMSEGTLRYGYFWWLAPGDGAPVWSAGFGNGGQRLSINRDLKIVVA